MLDEAASVVDDAVNSDALLPLALLCLRSSVLYAPPPLTLADTTAISNAQCRSIVVVDSLQSSRDDVITIVCFVVYYLTIQQTLICVCTVVLYMF